MDALASVCPHCRRDVPENVLRIRRSTAAMVIIVALLLTG
jgi:hypothetical protein